MNDPSSQREEVCKSELLIAAALLLVPSLLIATLQAEMTDVFLQWTKDLWKDYFSPDPGSIIAPRALPRWLLQICGYYIPELELRTTNIVLQTIALLGAGLCVSESARGFVTRGWQYAGAFFMLLCVPWGFTAMGFGLSFPYDIPAMFFSAIAVYTILTRQHRLFAAYLLLGGLNKETGYFLLFSWVGTMLLDKVSRREVALRFCLLLLAFSVEYFLIRYLMRDSQGSAESVTVSFYENIGIPRWLANWRELTGFAHSEWNMNPFWALSMHIPPVLFFRRLPAEIRRIYWGVPFFVIPNWFLGNIWETRIYNELLPISTLALVCLVAEFEKNRRTL